jgi:hypothetical protein
MHTCYNSKSGSLILLKLISYLSNIIADVFFLTMVKLQANVRTPDMHYCMH